MPVTAFEVVDTIWPQYILSAPVSGVAGTVQTLTVQYLFPQNTNFSHGLYTYWSNDGGSTWHSFSPYYQVTPGNIGPFTYNWTPASAGTYLLRTTPDSGYWLRPPNITFTATASQRTVSSTTDGYWDQTATWGGNTPPGSGDIAVVTNNVTIRSNTIIGDGTATTVLTCASGTITVQGATFTIRGNSTWGQTSGPGNTKYVLTVQPDANSGTVSAGIEFDGNSGVTPTMTVNNDSLVTFAGTAAARTFMRMRSGTAASPAVVVNGVLNTNWFASFSYCDFTGLGTATTPAISFSYPYLSNNIAHPPVVFDHCTITSCGQLPYVGIHGAAMNVQFTNCIWNAPVDANGYSVFISPSVAMSGGGTRIIDHCQFGGWLYMLSGGNFTITNNLITKLFANKGPILWTAFDGNFIHAMTQDEHQVCGDTTNNFFLFDPPNPSAPNFALRGILSANLRRHSFFRQCVSVAGNGGDWRQQMPGDHRGERDAAHP